MVRDQLEFGKKDHETRWKDELAHGAWSEYEGEHLNDSCETELPEPKRMVGNKVCFQTPDGEAGDR